MKKRSVIARKWNAKFAATGEKRNRLKSSYIGLKKYERIEGTLDGRQKGRTAICRRRKISSGG